MDQQKIQNASFFKRLAAFYLAFFIVAIFSLAVTIFLRYGEFIKADYLSIDFLINFSWIFFLISFTDAFFQCLLTANIAKYLLGLKILHSWKDRPLTLTKALIRSFASYVSVLFFGIGFIAIAFNKDRSSLHDYLANSKVIEIKRSKFANFCTNFIALLSVLLGLLVTLILIGSLLFSLNYSLKTIKDTRKYLTFSQETFGEDYSPVILPLSHTRLAALTEYYRFAEFIEYQVDPLANQSSIQEAKLRLLGVSNLDYYYEIKLLSQNPLKLRLERYIIVPKLIFKTNEGKDFSVENFKFLVSTKSVIANDLLSSFDYKLNSASIDLNLYSEDAKILSNPELDLESKLFLISVLRQIRMAWKEALRYAPVNLLEDLSSQATDEVIQNEIQLQINTETGDMQKVTLLNPNKIESFNLFCEDFLSSLPRLKFIPNGLKSKNPLVVDLSLTYRDKL